MVGRPSFIVDTEQVNVLPEYHFNWTQIANIIDIHCSTLWRKLKKCWYNFEEKCSTISPEELKREITVIKEKHRLTGEKMVIGFLKSKGLRFQRSRVGIVSMHLIPSTVSIGGYRKILVGSTVSLDQTAFGTMTD